MRLILRERQDLEHPEVIIEYRELTDGVKRVSAFVRSVDQSISCKREGKEFSIPLSDVFYIESVDKKTFVYGETEVYQTGLRLAELEKMLSHAGFVRVSKSVILNIEKLVLVSGIIFGWYSSLPTPVLCFMILVMLVLCGYLDMLGIKNEIREINDLIGENH